MDNELFDIEKALDTTATSTGAVLIPEEINPGIRRYVEERSPLWNLLPKESIRTNSYSYRELNGLPQASFGAELGALPAAEHGTYVERTFPVKSIYVRGEISGQMIDSGEPLGNVVQREIRNSTIGLARTLESAIVSADSSVNPNQFDGLLKQITRVVAPAGATETTHVKLTLAFMDELTDAAPGSDPTHYIMSKAAGRKLWSLLQAQQRYVDTMDVAGGTRVPSYQGHPIIRLFDNLPVLDDKIIAPNLDFVKVPVQRDATYEELAKTRDAIDYFIRMYLTLVVEGASRHHAVGQFLDFTVGA